MTKTNLKHSQEGPVIAKSPPAAASMSNVFPLKSNGPSIENSNVPVAPRQPNAAVRTREHLTPVEVDRLVRAAGKVGRYRKRDAALILVMYRHGLRVTEAIELSRSDLDLDSRNKTLFVRRIKNGSPATHPLTGPVARALRTVLADFPDSRRVFVTERGGALSSSAVRRIVKRAGELAGLPFPVHPHMLRHATGFYLANRGTDTRTIQSYLGHRNIQHTVRYTELAPNRFNGLWD